MESPHQPQKHPEKPTPIWRRKELLVLLALFLTLTAPFLLRSKNSSTPGSFDRRLVILSPHNERVRQEIGHAFARHWKAKTGETLYVDWRIPGGASEIAMFLRSEFTSAFEFLYENQLGKSWNRDIAASFADPGIKPEASGPAADARRTFLDSSVGIGVDLLFGGGSYDFQQFGKAGYLVAGSTTPPRGPLGVMELHPDWFEESAIPEQVNGEIFRDHDNQWMGVVLASFGIVYNRDVLNRLKISEEPSQWANLADPRLQGQVALADPTKSGSVAKAFELMIQQQIWIVLEEARQHSKAPEDDPEQIRLAVHKGWEKGLQLIQSISANARYFTDSASKIPLEVSRGDAAEGMAIDSYGRSAEEYVRQKNGWSRVGFVAPLGGTSISVDPIGMLRGAPNPDIATAFIEFVLSPEGQKLWAFRPGTPEGPIEAALRRLPVRRDIYTDQNRQFMSDTREDPYLKAESFHYRAEWTGPVFGVLRFLIRVMCIDTHAEQKAAWQALIKNHFPKDAVAAFQNLEQLSYDNAVKKIAPILKSKDRMEEIRLARELSERFRAQYQNAYKLANKSEGGHE